jgi:hypothetical protein
MTPSANPPAEEKPSEEPAASEPIDYSAMMSTYMAEYPSLF